MMLFGKKLRQFAKTVYKRIEYIRYRGLIGKNSVLQNKYRGKRIFILGEGVSLKELDLARLQGEFTMGCNYIATHKDFPKLDLSFYSLAASRRAIRRHNARIAKLSPEIRPPSNFEEALFSLDGQTRTTPTQFFFDASMKSFIEHHQLFRDHSVFYVLSGGKCLSAQNGVGLDLTRPLSTMEGSLFFMISLASFMGFTEIYLCGCGYTYIPHQHGHFYDNITLVEGQDVDPRYQILQAAVARGDGRIYNLVPEGFQSPVYPAVRIKELSQLLSSSTTQRQHVNS